MNGKVTHMVKKIVISLFCLMGGAFAMDLPSEEQSFSEGPQTDVGLMSPDIMSPGSEAVSAVQSRAVTPHGGNPLMLALMQLANPQLLSFVPPTQVFRMPAQTAAQRFDEELSAFQVAPAPQSVMLADPFWVSVYHAEPAPLVMESVGRVDRGTKRKQDYTYGLAVPQQRKVVSVPQKAPRVQPQITGEFKTPHDATKAMRQKHGNDSKRIRKAMVAAVAAEGEKCAKEFGLFIPDELM